MCDMKRISAIAGKNDIRIVEDAAHCIEGQREGIQPGHLSDMACFSFYATKNITCGEGGAIGTTDRNLAELLRKLRLHGLSADAASRYEKKFKHYDMEILGYKANMSNISAALLLGQLSRIDKLHARRDEIAARYETAFSEVKSVRTMTVPDRSRPARHLFTIRVSGMERDEFITRLQEQGVGAAVNYRPIHLASYYRDKYGYHEGMFPVAERIGEETVSIPLYPRLTDSEVTYVADSVKEVLEAER
jgi:UDP-4-amino-4-deoxy-L-arabinose-oxoglutarate aminotransferase